MAGSQGPRDPLVPTLHPISPRPKSPAHSFLRLGEEALAEGAGLRGWGLSSHRPRKPRKAAEREGETAPLQARGALGPGRLL